MLRGSTSGRVTTAYSNVGPTPSSSIRRTPGKGKSNRGIAESFVITETAVEKHVTRIFSKLDLGQSTTAHRRLVAVLTYLRNSR
jgi:DNA-binding NarL/FixJ family response regulator